MLLSVQYDFGDGIMEGDKLIFVVHEAVNISCITCVKDLLGLVSRRCL